MSEKELIQQMLAGDEAAKTRFYESHVGRLKPICIHFLGFEDPDIEDILQETFLIAFRKLPEFEPRSTLYTWIAHICVNLCYQRLHKRHKALVTEAEALEQAASSMAETRQEEKEEQEGKDRIIGLLRRLIETMGEKCRRILDLRDLKGESYVSICKALKVPMGTVMSQLARCRDTLRKMVQSSLGGNL